MSNSKFTTAQKRSQRYLRTIQLAERRIKVLESEIELQQSRLSLNGVSGGENVNKTLEGDAQERGFVKLYKLCDDLDTELCDYVDYRDEGFRIISKLKDQRHYDIIYLRYFKCYKFSDIADEVYMSENSVYKHHKIALSVLYKFIPAEFKQVRR